MSVLLIWLTWRCACVCMVWLNLAACVGGGVFGSAIPGLYGVYLM